MLVLFGANGLTGLQVLRQAQSQSLPIRPVVRDDRDIGHIKGLADVQTLCYADPMVPSALAAVMEGAEVVVSCIDPRTSGPGAILYEGQAAENITNAARDAGARVILHVSVMGAYRWSYASLNRKSFYLEGGVRNCNAPWTILRFSCYHDEILQAHVRPPDGGAPIPFKVGSRYSPITRQDAARAILDVLQQIEHPGRALALGGPQTFTGPELTAMVAPFKRGAGKTKYKPLPPGDVSVATTTTQATLRRVPRQPLQQALSALDEQGDPDPEVPTVYPHGDPAPHPADGGGSPRALSECDADLRWTVHEQLIQDSRRLNLDVARATLDFSAARPQARWVSVHGGRVAELKGVVLRDQAGAVLHQGELALLRDTLADEFYCWWRRGHTGQPAGIPEQIWLLLDAGVQRRIQAKAQP